MSANTSQNQKDAAHRSVGVRHTKEDALSDLKFEKLYNATFELEPLEDLESRFILVVGGRLGLRRGEIAHMQESWIDWRKRRIEIPRYMDCDLGRDNRACGDCRQHATQMAEYNEGVTFESAIAGMWQPKTENAARAVPYEFSPRAEIALQEYFDKFDRWMYSAQVINRRLQKAADIAGIEQNIYPHALRGTAATFLAGRKMDAFALQAMFGWADLSTALNYISTSPDRTARELRRING